MRKILMTLIALLGSTLTSAAQSWIVPTDTGFRYSEQLSNGPAGDCGCFPLQGGAADAYWRIRPSQPAQSANGLGIAADIGVENTGSVDGAGYGLSLATFTAGPRLRLPVKSAQIFVQALFGLAHGFNSEFPRRDTLVSSANSLDIDLGGGVDYRLNHRFSLRILQLDYLRTALPNNTNNWQNNLRIGAGIILHFPRS
jgi:outer membrane immunogenic protein